MTLGMLCQFAALFFLYRNMVQGIEIQICYVTLKKNSNTVVKIYGCS